MPTDTDKFAVSQGAVLWVGGVETTAATLSFCLFELAQNPGLQEQLRNLSSPSTLPLLRQVIAGEQQLISNLFLVIHQRMFCDLHLK